MMTQKQIDDMIYASMDAYEEPTAFARRIEAAATTAEREACAALFQRLERTEQDIAQHMTAAVDAERERIAQKLDAVAAERLQCYESTGDHAYLEQFSALEYAARLARGA